MSDNSDEDSNDLSATSFIIEAIEVNELQTDSRQLRLTASSLPADTEHSIDIIQTLLCRQMIEKQVEGRRSSNRIIIRSNSEHREELSRSVS